MSAAVEPIRWCSACRCSGHDLSAHRNLGMAAVQVCVALRADENLGRLWLGALERIVRVEWREDCVCNLVGAGVSTELALAEAGRAFRAGDLSRARRWVDLGRRLLLREQRHREGASA